MACFICPFHGRVRDGECPEGNETPCPFLREQGPDYTKKCLVARRYKGISKKDAYGILVALGLSR